MAPRSLYVHIPFCRHRCGYCNFSLIAGRDHWIDRYLRALVIELESLPERLEIDTLYFGGGTPSHLSDAQWTFLFDRLDEHLIRSVECEVSCECNPSDMDAARVDLLRDRGVNRISLGIQSFRDAKLAQLDRDHSASEVDGAIERSRRLIPRLSIDLIFGVREETVAQSRDELTRAFSCGATHVSTYGLTIEKGTLFFNDAIHDRPHDSDEESAAEMYEELCRSAPKYGFEHYEISSFARPGHRCRHNEVYWSGQEYFAIGSGAASYLNAVRRSNHRSPITYTRRIEAGRSPVVVEDELPPEDRARELLVIGMRRLAGVDKTRFLNLTGFSVDQLISGRIEREIVGGLIDDRVDSISLTSAGLLVSDAIWAKLL